MHIPDGFIDAPTSAVAGAGAIVAVSYSLRRVKDTPELTPMAGLLAAFVFALQMINFPIGGGTSGHLLGAALATYLLGRHLAVLSMTVIFVIQALVFADGGITALGLNVLNGAIVAGVVASALSSLRPWSVALGAWLSVLVASAAITVEFWLGGTAPISMRTFAWAMLGSHALIGLGEAGITVAIMRAVGDVRPDLIRGGGGRPLIGGALAVLVVGGAFVASRAPDGLISSIEQSGGSDPGGGDYAILLGGPAGTVLAALVGIGAVVLLLRVLASPLRAGGRPTADVALVASTAFVFSVAVTPARSVWAFGFYALLVALAALLAGTGWRALLRGLGMEVPFVAFALTIPFVAQGDRVDLGWLSLSEPGLWSAWNIVAKASLGVSTVTVLRSLYRPAEIVSALSSLGIPDRLVAIASFMIRYGHLLSDQVRRSAMGRRSRGDNPRWWWQAGATVRSAANLFVLSFQRGERVHRAMEARGFVGTLEGFAPHPTALRSGAAVVAPFVALAAVAATWSLR